MQFTYLVLFTYNIQYSLTSCSTQDKNPAVFDSQNLCVITVTFKKGIQKSGKHKVNNQLIC